MKRNAIRFGQALWLLVCLAQFSSAQPDPSATLRQLGDPSYDVRQDATLALLRDDTMTLEWIEDRYAEATTPEQRHRLMEIARHHVIRALRQGEERGVGPAAIGFSHEVLPGGTTPWSDGGAIHIVSTLAGFPAHAHLMPGDLIIGLDGEPLPTDLTADGFKAILQRWRPGETMALTIVRNTQERTVELELASMEMLLKMYAEDPQLRARYLLQWTGVHNRLAALAPPVQVLRPEQP